LGLFLLDLFGGNIWFKRSLGSVFLISLGCIYLKENFSTEIETSDFNAIWDTRKMIAITTSVCLLSGVLSGIAGLGGPPFILFVLYYNFERDTFIATFVGSRVLASIQVLVFLLLDPENALSEELLPSIIGAMFAGFFGVLIGTRIAGKVDQKMFSKVLQIILTAASVLIVLDETGLEFHITGGVMGLIILYNISLVLISKRSNLEHQKLQETSTQTYTNPKLRPAVYVAESLDKSTVSHIAITSPSI